MTKEEEIMGGREVCKRYVYVFVFTFVFISMLCAYDNQSTHWDMKQYKMDECVRWKQGQPRLKTSMQVEG